MKQRKFRRASLLFLLLFTSLGCLIAKAGGPLKEDLEIRIVPDAANRRVDVTANGHPFTSYIFPETIKKPVLFPLRSPKGTIVTRGFPLDTQPNEPKDHPHQVGVWLTYGSVNGFDFWGNSSSVKEQSKMGTIYHRNIRQIKNGKQGELIVGMDWVTAEPKTILHEDTRFIFRASANRRTIDRITKLTAQNTTVVFKDDKEGMFGLRVVPALEQPSSKAAQNTTEKTGLYRSSAGRTGDAVWGTRGQWVMLTGKVAGEPVTLAILDHPKNPGYPTYWHARGYGLFAANPLGQKIFSNGKEEINLSIEPNQPVTFRYRLLILSGLASPEQMESESARFASEIDQ